MDGTANIGGKPVANEPGLYLGQIIVHEHDDIEVALARHGYTADDKVIVHVIVAPDPNRFPEPAIADNVIWLSEVSRTRKAPR